VKADPRRLAKARIEGEEWTLLAQSPDEIAATGEMWAYRKIRVLGTVTGGPRRVRRKRAQFEPRYVKLSAVPVSDATWGQPAPVPWNPVWLAERGLGPREAKGSPDRYGRFEVEVPAVKGMAVVAHAPGWVPAHERISFTPGADFAVRISLHLDPAAVVCGNVGPGGRRRVTVYVLRAHYLSRFQPDLLLLVGHPFRLDVREDQAAVTFRAEGETEWDGEFQVPVHLDGDGVVVVDSRSREPSRVYRIRLSDGRETDIESGRSKMRRGSALLRFADGVAPVGDRVWITEDPDRARHPTFSVTLGGSGSGRYLAEGTLAYGREYEIGWSEGEPPGEMSARCKWKGGTIDLTRAKRTAPR
jgi:hypothetical protein